MRSSSISWGVAGGGDHNSPHLAARWLSSPGPVPEVLWHPGRARPSVEVLDISMAVRHAGGAWIRSADVQPPCVCTGADMLCSCTLRSPSSWDATTFLIKSEQLISLLTFLFLFMPTLIINIHQKWQILLFQKTFLFPFGKCIPAKEFQPAPVLTVSGRSDKTSTPKLDCS